MTTIPQKVQEIIERSAFLKEGLADDLVNVSSLARKIKPEIEDALMKDCTEASIVMALKRLSVKLRYDNKIDFSKYLGDISLKSGLFEYTYINSDTLYPTIADLIDSVKHHPEIYLTFVKGVFQTTLIASNSIQEEVKKVFKNEELEAEFKDLSAVTVRLINGFINEPGIIGYVLNIMAWNGVNIIEVVSTFSELTMIVKDEDVEDTFRTVNKLKKRVEGR